LNYVHGDSNMPPRNRVPRAKPSATLKRRPAASGLDCDMASCMMSVGARAEHGIATIERSTSSSSPPGRDMPPEKRICQNLDNRQLLTDRTGEGSSADHPVTLVRSLGGHGLVARGGKVVPWPIRAASIFPGGERIATAGEDGTLRVWSASSGEQLTNMPCHRAGILGAVIFPNGQQVLTTGNDGTACIWNVARGNLVAKLEGHDSPVVGGAVFPDGDRVITMGLDGSGRIWDISKKAIIAPLAGSEKTVVDIFQDGVHVVVAGEKGSAEVWACTGAHIAQIGDHQGSITALALFPDGERAVTAGEDGRACIWNAIKSSKIAELPRHEGNVRCSSVSAGGTHVLTGGEDGIVHLSDAVDGSHILSWTVDGRSPDTEGQTQDNAVHSVAFFRDGKRVLVAGDAGARIWELPVSARACPAEDEVSLQTPKIDVDD